MLLYIQTNIASQMAFELSRIAGVGKNGCQRDWHRATT